MKLKITVFLSFFFIWISTSYGSKIVFIDSTSEYTTTDFFLATAIRFYGLDYEKVLLENKKNAPHYVNNLIQSDVGAIVITARALQSSLVHVFRLLSRDTLW